MFKEFNLKTDKNEINASSVKAMTVSADFIGINNKYGNYAIGDNIGITKNIQIDKYKIKILGGIIVEIEEI